MDDLQPKIKEAIAEERRANDRRQTKRALIGAFVVIPLIVIGIIALWLLGGRLGWF
ncbi:MAG: hypothetical protein KDA29_12595 [Phycisphaerales bacterium]|nr:hypothetical protein [Phycisphaerales bacterium]